MAKQYRKITMATLVVIAALTVAAAQKSGSTSTSYQENVTTTIFDNDATGAQVLLRSDDYNGSGYATYVTPKVTRNSVISTIDSTGVWRLDLYSQSVRTLWITPNVAVNTLQPVGPPAGYYWQNVEAYSECRDQSGNVVPYENLVNGSGNCTFGVDFTAGGTEYKLLMSPSAVPPSGASCPSTGCPATGLVQVTCNSVSNGKCVAWTITPNAGAANLNVANLFSYTGTRSAPWVYIGQYHNSFRIQATYP